MFFFHELASLQKLALLCIQKPKTKSISYKLSIKQQQFFISQQYNQPQSMSFSFYNQTVFSIHQSHIQGSTVEIATNDKGTLLTVGSDDVACEFRNEESEAKVLMVENPHGFRVAKIAMKPNSDDNIVVIGTHDGSVIQYTLPKGTNHISPTLTHSHTIYLTQQSSSSQSTIRSLRFTNDGRFLIIITNELSCTIYDYQSKIFFKHKLQSETQFLTAVTDFANKFLCIIDLQGKAHIFRIEIKQSVEKMEIEDEEDSEDPFAAQEHNPRQQVVLKLLSSYKITNSSSSILKSNKFNITASFSQDSSSFMTQNLYLPGQNTLQKVQINLPPAQYSSQYQLCTNIIHSSQIIQSLWLRNQKAGLILTATQIQAIVWHQVKEQKVMVFNLSVLLGVDFRVKDLSIRRFIQNSNTNNEQQNWGFAFSTQQKNSSQGVQSTIGIVKVFDFKGFTQLQKQLIKHEMNQMSINQQHLLSQENNNNNNNIESQLKQQQQHTLSNNAKQVISKTQKQQSIAAKLLTVYMQQSLTHGYEKHAGDSARFLFYNNVGCVIQREVEGKESFLELQFHDRSKISRIKILQDGLLQHFALCSDTFMTASLNRLSVQCERHLKQGYMWEYDWQGIEGVAIGGDWVCSLNKTEIKVWDWVGNQLHSISFDRRFVAMAAYEDLLAIVYHSSLPMWGAQSYKMLLYQITPYTIKCIRNTNLPTKPTVPIKWFGFSQQGMLFCQDDSQILRCYMFQKDEWIQLMSLDPMVERLFIQHLQNYQIYGFKLQQRFPNEPRVIPRSLPRKIPIDLTSFKMPFLTAQQTQYYKKLKLSTYCVQHEKYRYQRWFKLKYSRTKDHRWYSHTISIRGEQQIRDLMAKMDLKLIDYVQKYIKIHRNDKNIERKHWRELLMLCLSLAFHQVTKNRLSEQLMQVDVELRPDRSLSVFACHQQTSAIFTQTKTTISQLDRLQQMMGLGNGWVDRVNIDGVMSMQQL